MTVRVARVAAIGAALWALAVVVIGGALTPGYSHVANYISELGATGSAVGAAVSYGGFLPVGLLSLTALVATLGRCEHPVALRSAHGWLVSVPIAYLASAFARCDTACAGVSSAQALHNLFGVAGYVGGAVALFVAALAYFRAHRAPAGLLLVGLGVAVLLALLTFGEPSTAHVHGATQRGAEVILFGFLLFVIRARTAGFARAAL